MNDANLEVVGNQYGTENLFLLSMGRGTTQKSRGGIRMENIQRLLGLQDKEAVSVALQSSTPKS